MQGYKPYYVEKRYTQQAPNQQSTYNDRSEQDEQLQESKKSTIINAGNNVDYFQNENTQLTGLTQQR